MSTLDRLFGQRKMSEEKMVSKLLERVCQRVFAKFGSALIGSGQWFRLTLPLTVAFLLCLTIAPPREAVFPKMVPPRVKADGPPGQQLIQVPLRWCVIGNDKNHNGKWDPGEDGVPAFKNPIAVGETDFNGVLSRRMDRVSDNTWCPQAGILFRSAVTAAATSLNYVIIPDPDPSRGLYGDIAIEEGPFGDISAVETAINLCEREWNKKDKTAQGPIVLNLGRFISKPPGMLVVSPTLGLTHSTAIDTMEGRGVFCTAPMERTVNPPGGWVAVTDNFYYRNKAEREADFTLAHELGHFLWLEHGDGRDNDVPANGKFDKICDPPEDELLLPTSLMHPSSDSANEITPLQRRAARSVAMGTPGIKMDPPGALLDGDVMSDQVFDAVQDVTDGAVDIAWVAMTVNKAAATTAFSHKLFGFIPLSLRAQYVVFADLDGNPATGGSPSDLGFLTSFRGAEFVTRVFVDSVGSRTIIPTVWKFEAGAFVMSSDPRIRADLLTSTEAETNTPAFALVSIQMPNAVMGPTSASVRIQAIAQDFGGTVGGQLDQLPNGPPDAGTNLTPTISQFPICSLTPSQVQPGGVTTVEAAGLLPNTMAKVLLGDQMVATGLIDASGNTSIQFVIPADAATGLRLVTVEVINTGLIADCGLVVAGPPGGSIKCDTIRFSSPQYWLFNLNRLPRGTVLIGGVNFNSPVSTGNVEAIKLALQGNALGFGTLTPLQRFNRGFVAAQLSLALAGGTGSPVASNVLWANLGCPGLFGDFAPVTLSNGVVLTPNSMLKDLFMQAQSAIQQNRVVDFIVLGAFFDALNCDDPFGSRFPSVNCPPPLGLPFPDLTILQAFCDRLSPPTTLRLTITVENIGSAPAPAPVAVIIQNAGGFPLASAVTTSTLAPMGGREVLYFTILGCVSPAVTPVACPSQVEVQSIGAEATKLNNFKPISCLP